MLKPQRRTNRQDLHNLVILLQILLFIALIAYCNRVVLDIENKEQLEQE